MRRSLMVWCLLAGELLAEGVLMSGCFRKGGEVVPFPGPVEGAVLQIYDVDGFRGVDMSEERLSGIASVRIDALSTEKILRSLRPVARPIWKVTRLGILRCPGGNYRLIVSFRGALIEVTESGECFKAVGEGAGLLDSVVRGAWQATGAGRE